MDYMICRHRVADYDKWRAVFDSHAAAQAEAGLHVLHVLRDASDPPMVVMLFRVADRAKAESFVTAPGAREAGDVSGVIGKAEIMFLQD